MENEELLEVGVLLIVRSSRPFDEGAATGCCDQMKEIRKKCEIVSQIDGQSYVLPRSYPNFEVKVLVSYNEKRYVYMNIVCINQLVSSIRNK